MKKKIAIVGTAPGTWEAAPWEDEEFDIWALAWRSVPRANVLFEMHQRKTWDGHGGPNYESRLAHSGVPIVMLEAQDDIPKSETYPVDAVKADLAPKGQEADFFTSSVAYMFALAIARGATTIGLFGCDLQAGEEYAYQKPAVLYLVGMARGRGIDVILPKNSPLLKANFVYGTYAGPDGAFQKSNCVTEEMLNLRIARYDTERVQVVEALEQIKSRISRIDGSLHEAKMLLETVQQFNRGAVINP